jgi:cytochrome c5
LLSLAGSNRAVGADNQKRALKTGAQLWQENCTMCHEDRPQTSFTPAQSDAARRHMQEKADLSPEEQEAILGFLKSGN